MYKEIRELLNSKHALMLFVVLVYILSLYSVLSSHIITVAVVFTFFLIIMLCSNLFSIKRVVVLLIIFYIGIANVLLREKEYDELLSISPADAVLTGKIVSIPNMIQEEK